MGRTVHLDYRTEDENIPDRIRLYTVTSPEKDKLEVLKNSYFLWVTRVV